MAWMGAQMAEAVGVEVDAPFAHRLEAPWAAVAFGDGDVGKLPEPVGVARRADVQAAQQIAIGIALEDGEPGKRVGADARRAQAHHVGADVRSAERRVGKEGVGTCSTRWSPEN